MIKNVTKLAKIEKICYKDIEFSLKAIKIFQEYLDKYEDESDGYVSLVKMVIKAYKSNLLSLSAIIYEIDPKFIKNLIMD